MHNPLPIHLQGNVFEFFYSGRNKDNKSSVSFVDIDIIDKKIVNYPSTPLIKYGNLKVFTHMALALETYMKVH